MHSYSALSNSRVCSLAGAAGQWGLLSLIVAAQRSKTDDVEMINAPKSKFAAKNLLQGGDASAQYVCFCTTSKELSTGGLEELTPATHVTVLGGPSGVAPALYGMELMQNEFRSLQLQIVSPLIRYCARLGEFMQVICQGVSAAFHAFAHQFDSQRFVHSTQEKHGFGCCSCWPHGFGM